MQQLFEFVSNHPIASAIWLALLVLVIASLVKSKLDQVNAVSSQQAVRLINKEDANVLDIRSAAEYNKGHIIDAVNIPQTDITNQIEKLEKYKSNPLIVVCVSGMQSGVVCKQLQKAGFSNLYRLNGGMGSWNNDKMPVSKS